MTSRFLLNDLSHEEGDKLYAYPDPLTGGEPITAGRGHTGSDVRLGMTVTQLMSDVWLRQDVDKVKAGLNQAIPWWAKLDDNRQDVLVQMAFQMGVAGLMEFTGTLAAAERGQYDLAADRMLKSKWATTDTPARAARMSAQMRSGLRAWAYMDGN